MLFLIWRSLCFLRSLRSFCTLLCMAALFLTLLITLQPLEGSLLSMRVALERSTTSHPNIQALESDVAMYRAHCVQAGLLKNPEFNIFIENFCGSRIYGGWRFSQITYALTQEFDVWKKRAAQVDFARLEEEIAAYDAMIARQIVRQQLIERFLTAYALQEKMRLAHERWKIAEEGLNLLRIHTAEGKLPAASLPEVELHTMRLRLGFEAKQRALKNAYHLLALHMGDKATDFHQLEHAFYALTEPLGNIMESAELQGHPLLAKARATVEASRQRIVVEKRVPLPSPQVLVGFRQIPGSLRGARDYAFVAGVTFPLMAWNRNQGAICAAKWQLAGDEARLKIAERQLTEELFERHQDLVHAYAEAKMHRDELLTRAEKHYQVSYNSFQEGLLSPSDWMHAQQEWFAIQEEAIDLLLLYHQKKEALGSLLELLVLETSLS